MRGSQQDLSFNKNEDQMKLKISKLNKRLHEAYLGGGKKKIEKHHAKGKLTAREKTYFWIKIRKELRLVHWQVTKCMKIMVDVHQAEW